MAVGYSSTYLTSRWTIAANMKFFVAIVALAMFISVQALTDEQKEKLKDHYKFCSTETGVDKELVKRTREGDFDFDDDKVKDFSFCMFKRMGVMDEEGNFNKEVALSKVGEDIRDKVSKAIDACIDKKGATPSETSWNYAKCYHNARPDHEII